MKKIIKKIILVLLCASILSLHAENDDTNHDHDRDHDSSNDYRAARGIEYDLSNVPPLDLDLIKHERRLQEVSSLQNIKEVVAQALTEDEDAGKTHGLFKNKKQLKKLMKNLSHDERKLFKKNRHKHDRHDKHAKQDLVSRDVRRLLDQQYQDPELVSKKITVKLKHADIKDALRLIGQITNTNFVVDADLTGVVEDSNFEDIALGTALNVLLTHNHPKLALIKESDVWRIVRFSEAVERLRDIAQDYTEQDWQSSCRTLFNARWDESFKKRAEKLWLGIVGTNEKNGVFIMFDDTSKKVFFQGRTRHVEAFEMCLQELDIRIPQVRIDARVVIANKDFDEALGFQWGGVYDQRASIKHFNFAGIGTFNETTPHNPNPITELLSWSLNLLPTSVKHAPIKIPVLFGGKDLNTKRLGLTLNAAEERREIKTILKPSLLVNNEETAEILVGEEMPQETRLDETIEGKLTNVTTVNYKDIGMKIRVKPVVSPDQQSVFLDIFVENSMVVPLHHARHHGHHGHNGQNNSGSLGGFNYTINTSRSKNRVLLKSGQSTMIGGLISHTKEHVKTGVPLLQEIPVIGWLFKGSQKVLSDKQLLLFITPTLV